MLLPVGLIIVDFLEIIYLLNIEKDRLIGKQTLAVIPRKRFAKGEYLFCILVALAVAGQLALIFSAFFSVCIATENVGLKL
jgi:hypothetical protein